MKRRLWVGLAAACLIAVPAVILLTSKGGHKPPSRHGPGKSAPSPPPLVHKQVLAALPRQQASSADTSRIAAGILPPTNSWLSGMVLQRTPLPVYPLPLSFLAAASHFEIGLPNVQAAPSAITGEHVPGIVVRPSGAADFRLTRYDKVSANLTYFDGRQQEIGTVTLAEGSPYVFYRALAGGNLSLGLAQAGVRSVSAQYARYSRNGHDYAVAVQAGATIRRQGNNLDIAVKKDSLVTFYSLPGNGNDPLRTFAGHALTSAKTSFARSGNRQLTTLDYQTADGGPTVLAPMPYRTVLSRNKTVAGYDSIYGYMTALAGRRFVLGAPQITPSNQLILAHLSDSQKSQLLSQLATDTDSTAIDKQDSYFAGKQLARAANLLDIAEQLKQPAQAARLKQSLNGAFAARLGGSYFYYDSQLKGIAAQNRAFGSEDFNDHHFHYGYFLYAASILGKYDPGFVKTYGAQMDLLAADIASYQPEPDFPIRRTFDPYAGHSWAAGLAPFADGNNQESSSEAMQAWNGVALWGELTHNPALSESGRWMLADESQAAAGAWRRVNIRGYTSPLVDINFGGKRVYSTFFTDDPGAKLGIQLIPMNPAFTAMSADGGNIGRLVDSSIQNDNFNVPLGDYALMYLALRDPHKAASLSPNQQDAFIDDGNSRTYLNAWIFSQLNR